MGSQRGHAEALVGVPDLDRGVAAGRDDVLSSTAENDVIDPVCVMLHGLEIRLLRVLYIPDPIINIKINDTSNTIHKLSLTIQLPDNTVSARTVQPLEIVVILKRIDSSSVTSLTLVTDHKRHLDFASSSHEYFFLASFRCLNAYLGAEQIKRSLSNI